MRPLNILLKRINQVNPFEACAFILLFALCIFAGASCGKRKPPLPPVERVAQEVEIDGAQKGTQITLIWKMPARNAPDGSALNISRADIYRLAEPLASPLSLTEEDFAANSTLIASIPIVDSDFAFKEKSYVDSLRFAGQPARLRYAIRFVNASGQKAAFSSFFLIEPTAKVATKPLDFRGVVSQESVNLDWKSPEINEDGSTPANILGYNLYRTNNDSEPKQLNKTPIKEPKFADEFFSFGDRYRYFVRTVSLGNDGRPIESSKSNTIIITPKDTFPPAAPSAITIAAAPNTISIFFATNIEKDVVGYKIYRSTDRTKPKSEWQQLTKNPLKTNTYQDSQIRTGTTYYYYLTAIDKYGNVSQPSTIVSEKAF